MVLDQPLLVDFLNHIFLRPWREEVVGIMADSPILHLRQPCVVERFRAAAAQVVSVINNQLDNEQSSGQSCIISM